MGAAPPAFPLPLSAYPAEQGLSLAAVLESRVRAETARGGLVVNVLETPLDFGVNLPEC